MEKNSQNLYPQIETQSSGYPHPQSQQPPSYETHQNFQPHQPQQPVIMQPYTDVPQNVQSEVHITMTPAVGPDPTPMTCPSCHAQIVTTIEYDITSRTHIAAGILCLFGLWCIVWLPYCMRSCRNRNHYCPSCGAFIGTHKN